jgi:hypothetical protein
MRKIRERIFYVIFMSLQHSTYRVDVYIRDKRQVLITSILSYWMNLYSIVAPLSDRKKPAYVVKPSVFIDYR